MQVKMAALQSPSHGGPLRVTTHFADPGMRYILLKSIELAKPYSL